MLAQFRLVSWAVNFFAVVVKLSLCWGGRTLSARRADSESGPTCLADKVKGRWRP